MDLRWIGFKKLIWNKNADIATGSQESRGDIWFYGSQTRPFKLLGACADFKMFFYNSQIYF